MKGDAEMQQPKQPKRLASSLALITLIGACLQPLLAIGLWAYWDQLAMLGAGNLAHIYDATALSSTARLFGFAVFFTGAFIQAFGLLGLRRMFLEARSGRSFSARSIQGFRIFAWVSLALVFWSIFQHSVLSVLLSSNDPARDRALHIEFGSGQVGALFTAVLLVFVALVLAEGKRAKDETDSFI